MTNLLALKIGSRVHYQPEHYGEDEWKNGLVLEIPNFATDPNAQIGFNLSISQNTQVGFYSVRVVYNCDNDWENFRNYASALTDLSDLKLGWR